MRVSDNLEPLGLPIAGMEDTILRSGARLGIDATKPPVTQPQKRIQFERLKARGEGKVYLKDFKQLNSVHNKINM